MIHSGAFAGQEDMIRKMVGLFAAWVCYGFAGLMLASQVPAPAPATARSVPVVSPEVRPDRRVVFRLRAPQAGEVTIAGDFWAEQDTIGARTEKLIKDTQGVWSFTSEPLPPNYYTYWFTVDGIPMPDPVNILIKQGMGVTHSAFWVPGEETAYLEAKSVPHGEVRQVYYQAAVIGKVRRMHVYLPPGYETQQTRYPVIYLFHGGGDDDWAWTTIGRANFILDNLIAQGKAAQMIVVMPSLYALDPPVRADRREENRELFRKSLVEDIIPYVESHYRTLTGSAHRAAGGLGIGREDTPTILWPLFDKFDYIVHTSGGADPEILPLLEKKYPDMLDNPANSKRMKFFLGNGIHDHSLAAAKNYADVLKKRGYSTTLYLSSGTHGWPWFRLYFAEFAKVAFR